MTAVDNHARRPVNGVAGKETSSSPASFSTGRHPAAGEVLARLHSAVVSRQFELLQRAEAAARRFTDLALKGADDRVLLNSLAAFARNPVVFEDSAHQVVEAATYAQPIDATLQQWEAHSRCGHDDADGQGAVRVSDLDPSCTWVEIWLRGEFWGRLHVLHMDSEPDELLGLVLDRTAATFALTLLAERDASQLADRARSSGLVSELVRGRLGSAEELYASARSLNIDLEGRRLAVLVVDLSELKPTRSFSERDRHRMRLVALSELRKAVAHVQGACLAGIEGERIIGVLGVQQLGDIHPVLEAIASRTLASIQSAGAFEAVIGVSSEARADALQPAFGEAREAARYAWHVGGTPRIAHYDNLGLHQLLLPLAQRPELARFVESELGRLLEHDAGSTAPLLPTLRVYLARTGNKAEATRELNIERRTLYRRLERIERILGRGIYDHGCQTRLTIALYGLDLLREKTRQHWLLAG